MTNLATIAPAHCYARATRLLAQLDHPWVETGRPADTRQPPEVTNAKPREVYFAAIAAWHKASRLADELGGCSGRAAPAIPPIASIVPGHCFELIDAVSATIEDVASALGATAKVAEAAIEPARQPSDVLVQLVKANRQLSRLLERPMAPRDCHRVVALALAYARRVGVPPVETVAFERAKQPADCYRALEACLVTVEKRLVAKGQTALAARASLPDAAPTDVYDLANLVLGEVAFLHSLDGAHPPIHAFEPGGHGHRLPAHVYQLARTLDAQLAAL